MRGSPPTCRVGRLCSPLETIGPRACMLGQRMRAGINLLAFCGNHQKPAALNLFLRSQGGGYVDPNHLHADRLVLSANGQQQEFAFPEGKPQIKGNPVNHDIEVTLQVQAGVVGFTLWSDTGEPFEVDAYLLGGGKFHPALARAAEIVASPGTAAAAITIGSYDWNDQFNQQGRVVTVGDPCSGNPMQIGNLSCYSSVGYSRDGTIKPDIVSPGEIYYAPYPRYPNGTGAHPEEWHVDTSGNYMQMNGTSSAAPYTSGVIALMLQKKPDLTTGEIKNVAGAERDAGSVYGHRAESGLGLRKTRYRRRAGRVKRDSLTGMAFDCNGRLATTTEMKIVHEDDSSRAGCGATGVGKPRRGVVATGFALLCLCLPSSFARASVDYGSPWEQSAAPSGGQPQDTSRLLELGKPIERELRGGEIHTYRIDVEPGQFIRIIIEKKGMAAAGALIGPDGKLIAIAERTNGPFGVEPVSAIVAAGGGCVSSVFFREQNAPPGGYEVTLTDLRLRRPEDSIDRRRARLF